MILLNDQQALSFLVQQAAYIEPEVDRIEYADIQYPDLVPVDFSAPEWVKTITYFSMDKVGQAQWFAGNARDVPRADASMNRYDTHVSMAAIGYGYNIEEISQAAGLRIRLDAERASAARRAYEEFVDARLMLGDTQKGYTGVVNSSAVTAVTAAADGTGSSSAWAAKTPDQKIRDMNAALTGIYIGSNTVEIADTLLLPFERWLTITSEARTSTSDETTFNFFLRSNVYTAQTGRPLRVRAVRGLLTAGAGGTARMVAYRRAPDVLKAHIPMRHKFLEPMRTGPLLYEVPGIFRFGGVDIKRPAAMRYVDGI